MVETLGTTHRFAVVISPWTDRMVDRIRCEVVRSFKTLLHMRRRSKVDWAQVVPMVQGALNAGYLELCQACPFKICLGASPGRHP